MDLMGHASGKNHATSGYVATSLDKEVAEGFGPNVYTIRASGGVDVNLRLGEDSPFPHEAEIAMPGGVHPTAPSWSVFVRFSGDFLDAVDGEGFSVVAEVAAGVGDVGASGVSNGVD